MFRLMELAGPVVLVLWIYCVVEVILTREEDARHLGKTVWLLLVLFFPLVGSIAWLAVGRPAKTAVPRSPYERQAPAFPEYDRPGRAAATSAEVDEEFLRKVRERAEEQRRRERERRRQAGTEE